MMWKSEVFNDMVPRMNSDDSVTSSQTSVKYVVSPSRSPLLLGLSRLVNSIRSPGKRILIKESSINTMNGKTQNAT